MKNLKDYILDSWFELEAFFLVLLDYRKLPINPLFSDQLSYILSHKMTWFLWGRIYPDENGKWKVWSLK